MPNEPGSPPEPRRTTWRPAKPAPRPPKELPPEVEAAIEKYQQQTAPGKSWSRVALVAGAGVISVALCSGAFLLKFLTGAEVFTTLGVLAVGYLLLRIEARLREIRDELRRRP